MSYSSAPLLRAATGHRSVFGRFPGPPHRVSTVAAAAMVIVACAQKVAPPAVPTFACVTSVRGMVALCSEYSAHRPDAGSACAVVSTTATEATACPTEMNSAVCTTRVRYDSMTVDGAIYYYTNDPDSITAARNTCTSGGGTFTVK